ncbi:ROK family protein [bacterium]|nr:ROK family protein [bacterium]
MDQVNGKALYAGIDLGGTKILTVVEDGERNVLAKTKIPTEASRGVGVVMDNIARSLEISCKEAEISPDRLAGIGIGVPGPVNYEKGLVYDCPNLSGWKNIEVRRLLNERWNVPVMVENDARVAGLAETRIGAAKGLRHVFYITVSTGIGSAIIIDGKIYHGADGAAGEFGQMKLLDGSVLEQKFAGPAIERLFGVLTTQLAELIKKNDPGAKRALKHLTDGTGTFLANIVTLLDPQIIVVGGGVSQLGELILQPIREKVSSLAFSIGAKNVKIVPAALATDSGALGAAELLFD